MRLVMTLILAAALSSGATAQEELTAAVPAEDGAPADDTAATDGEAETLADDAVALILEPVDGTTVTLDEFRWIARPIVVFADSPADPRFQKQMEFLAERPEPLAERDVVVIADTDPDARSSIRTKLRPRGFMMVLMAKDGTVNLRKPFPWDVREITRSIDKMPLRQQEMRDQNRPGG